MSLSPGCLRVRERRRSCSASWLEGEFELVVTERICSQSSRPRSRARNSRRHLDEAEISGFLGAVARSRRDGSRIPKRARHHLEGPEGRLSDRGGGVRARHARNRRRRTCSNSKARSPCSPRAPSSTASHRGLARITRFRTRESASARGRLARRRRRERSLRRSGRRARRRRASLQAPPIPLRRRRSKPRRRRRLAPPHPRGRSAPLPLPRSIRARAAPVGTRSRPRASRA